MIPLILCQESSERHEAAPNPDCERMQSVLRLSDLSTDDDAATCCKINQYEKKIDNLMNMVGTLKKEVRRQWKDLLTGAL